MQSPRLPTIILLTAAFVFAHSANTAAQQGSKKIDSVLASANGEAVTLLDVILETGQAERDLTGVFSGERLKTEVIRLRRTAVENAIDRKLVYKRYLEKPFDIPAQEIENILDGIARNLGASTRAELEKYARLHGSSLRELRQRAKEKIAVDVMLQQYCDRAVYVTPKEVSEEYDRNPAEWTQSAKLELQLIQILHDAPDAKLAVEAVRTELAKDPTESAFARLARQRSGGFNADKGGMAGTLDFDKLRPEFADALRGKPAGFIAGPVRTPEANYFLRIVSLHPARRIPFSKVSETIRLRLRAQRIRTARAEYIKDLRARSVVRVFY